MLSKGVQVLELMNRVESVLKIENKKDKLNK